MNKNFNVYVLSLPRCGSSMMTGIVEKLGVEIKHTTEDEEEAKRREENEKKRYGETYRMNPHFFELTKNPFKNWMDIYSTPYSGCKVIIPVNGFRWEAMCSKPTKVIMMWRDPTEIRQSQEASYKQARADYGQRNLERRQAFIDTVTKVIMAFDPEADELNIENACIDGFDEYFEKLKPKDKDAHEYAEAFLRTYLAETEVMLTQRHELSEEDAANGNVDVPEFDFKIVKYRDVLEDPEAMVIEIAKFINADPERVPDAIATVDPSLNRFKKEELVLDV